MVASDSDIKTLNGTVGWSVFWLMWFLFIAGFIFWVKVCDIAADTKKIRTTITQQAKECRNTDTLEIKDRQ